MEFNKNVNLLKRVISCSVPLKGNRKYEKSIPKSLFLLGKCIFFYPRRAKICLKPLFSVFLYLNFEYQHINHNHTE